MQGQCSLSVAALTAAFAVFQKTRPGSHGDCDDDRDDIDADENEHFITTPSLQHLKCHPQHQKHHIHKDVSRNYHHPCIILQPFHGRWLGAGITDFSSIPITTQSIMISLFYHLSMADGWVLETQLPSHLASSTSSSQVLTSSFVGPYSSWIGFFVKSTPPGPIGFIWQKFLAWAFCVSWAQIRSQAEFSLKFLLPHFPSVRTQTCSPN